MEEVCQICDKVFANKKALGGHMRIHYRKQTLAVDVDNSAKKNGVSCQQCAQSFPSTRSLAGHMKVHSKILHHGNDGYSETSKKRPKIKHDVVSSDDIRKREWAAETLIMLSNYVREESITETSDDDGYYGAVNDSEISLSSGSLDVNDDVDYELDARNKTKVRVDTSRNIIKKRRLNKAQSKLHCANDAMESDMDEDVSEVVSCGKSGVRVQDSGLERNYSENADKTLTGLKKQDASKGKEHQCPICFRLFSTGQAMGGHKRSHFAKSKIKEETDVKREIDEINDDIDLNFPIADEGGKADHH